MSTTPAGTESVSPVSTSGRLPVVAIVGRPNAGKSTLFNRLIRQRKAVVNDTPGVTRDRNFAPAKWRDTPFVLVDTGGIDSSEAEGVVGQVQGQTRLAIDEADLIIFLFDGKEGLNPADADAVDLLRRSGKPVFFAVNKIDGDKQEAATADFFALGLDTLFPISTAHGRGVTDLLEALVERFPAREPEKGAERAASALPKEVAELRVAIVGRPNVGKSSLLNRLVGFERSIVDATPGTTRDAVDSLIEWQGTPIRLVDTAGVRRRPRIHESIEQASVLIALKALERAEIGLLVIDAVEGMTDQDARLAQYAWERGRGLVLVVNKWDALPSERKHQAHYVEDLRHFFPVTLPLPVVFLSALTGSRVNTLLPMVARVAQAHATEIATPLLNRHLQEWTRRHPPPSYKGKQPKLFYATQVSTKPPLIAIFASVPEGIPATYTRYLENQLRETFGLGGTPIKLSFRARRKERE
ncbi:MAG TPA: ribosome biogenesis GTPase Der [Candidatus Binatia bacterium]|jgi:GTP-binding protein|nr:ribosome biogenesis GTPase Der [Candidatus Binatia bacterium]